MSYQSVQRNIHLAFLFFCSKVKSTKKKVLSYCKNHKLRKKFANGLMGAQRMFQHKTNSDGTMGGQHDEGYYI